MHTICYVAFCCIVALDGFMWFIYIIIIYLFIFCYLSIHIFHGRFAVNETIISFSGFQWTGPEGYGWNISLPNRNITRYQSASRVHFSWDVLLICTQARISEMHRSLYRWYRWLSARLQHLHCVSNGDTTVLHYAIDIAKIPYNHFCMFREYVGVYTGDIDGLV